ncbi:MAG: hypothetical protein WDO13_20225 [Verrucomicrobiota bacterium]
MAPASSRRGRSTGSSATASPPIGHVGYERNYRRVTRTISLRHAWAAAPTSSITLRTNAALTLRGAGTSLAAPAGDAPQTLALPASAKANVDGHVILDLGLDQRRAARAADRDGPLSTGGAWEYSLDGKTWAPAGAFRADAIRRAAAPGRRAHAAPSPRRARWQSLRLRHRRARAAGPPLRGHARHHHRRVARGSARAGGPGRIELRRHAAARRHVGQRPRSRLPLPPRHRRPRRPTWPPRRPSTPLSTAAPSPAPTSASRACG